MPRDGSPRATAIRPCIRQRSESRAGLSRSRPSGGARAPRAALSRSSCSSQASASAHRICARSSRDRSGCLSARHEQLDGLCAVPLLEGPNRRRVKVLRHEAAQYTPYTVRR